MGSEIHFYKKKKRISREKVGAFLGMLAEMAVVIVIAGILVYFFGIQAKVIGQSMEPEIKNGDTVWLNRFVYMVSSPKSGDVIAFYPNGNKDANVSIKRVIGVPGDTIQIVDGCIYINGEIFEEKYEISVLKESGLAEDKLTIGANEYFVLGDNRANSEDSRHANIGNVTKSEIAGRVWLRASSFRDIHMVH